jgi:AcrR family transcriptional regulator
MRRDGSRINGSIRDEVKSLKRERIVEAAIELFYDHGYENTTLDAVAERLGITKPFIYSHFDSKSLLLAEICSRAIAASLEAINSVLGSSMSATERLRLVGKTFALAVLRNQKAIAIFSREVKNLLPHDFKRISDMRREFDRKLTSILDQGAKNGEFNISHTRLACLAIDGIVSWTYVWYRPNGHFDELELADRLSALILATVGVAQKRNASPRSRGRARAISRSHST